MSIDGQKHTIKCRCILPQYKRRTKPVFHEFVVFSEIVDDKVKPAFAQCNNCGIVHKIIDLCKSEILQSKEDARGLTTIEDVVIGMNPDVVNLLKGLNSDLATFQEVSFYIDNNITGKKILIEKEEVEDMVVGKYLTIKDNGMFKVEPFNYQLGFKR